jgi:hypothetical protein
MPSPTKSDVSIYRKSKAAAVEKKPAITFDGLKYRRDFSCYTNIFDQALHAYMTLSTLPDVGRLPKFKIAATETGSGNNS